MLTLGCRYTKFSLLSLKMGCNGNGIYWLVSLALMNLLSFLCWLQLGYYFVEMATVSCKIFSVNSCLMVAEKPDTLPTMPLRYDAQPYRLPKWQFNLLPLLLINSHLLCRAHKLACIFSKIRKFSDSICLKYGFARHWVFATTRSFFIN